MRMFNDCGSIAIKQGVLLDPARLRRTVSAPSGKTVTGTIHGPGWVLKLAHDWRLVHATRKGGFTLQHVTSGATQKK